MTQDKKPKKNDIEKLRMILDSPSDPKVRKIVAKHEKNLESIRERLSGKPSKTKMKHTTSDLLKKSDSLEPRVAIHEKEEEVVPSEIESHIPEQQKEESKDDDADLQDLFDAEDLYEVEKVDVPEPEFLEVKPKEMEKVFEKTPVETEEPLPTPIQDEKEPTEVHEKEEELPEWEPVEETKPKEIEETVEEKEEQTPKEFLEVTTVDEKTMPQDSAGETEEEIPTWEPIELEETRAEKEISSGVIDEKPADETLGTVSEQKEGEPEITVKETKAELKRKEKELKKRRKEEQKLKQLEEKKARREAKQQEREERKSEREKRLRTKEYEQKKKQKEEEKQKQLEAKKEREHISEIGAREKQEKEVLSRSERKKQKREAKKAESKIPKLEADEDLSFEEKIIEDKPTEWESYDLDEIPEEKPDASVYTYGDFTLYKKEIKTTTGKKRTVHFFSKKTPDIGDAVQLPDGFEVKVNKRTGLPYLKKKK